MRIRTKYGFTVPVYWHQCTLKVTFTNGYIINNKKGRRFNLRPFHNLCTSAIAVGIAISAAAVAVLTTFSAGFRRFFTIIGEVAAAIMSALLAGFRRFFAIVCEVARILVRHVSHSSMDTDSCGLNSVISLHYLRAEERSTSFR
jgi:hypothetical protein